MCRDIRNTLARMRFAIITRDEESFCCYNVVQTMGEGRLEIVQALLRTANIAICATMILLLLFLLFFTAFIIPLGLTILLQICVFAGFLAFEVNKSRSLARHAIVFALIVATTGAGFFYTVSLMSAYAPRPRKPAKQTEWAIPQAETAGLASDWRGSLG